MKSLEEILNQKPVFLNEWSNEESVFGSFTDYFYDEEVKKEAYKQFEGVNILFASYGCANYSGHGWVLYEQDGKLYETSGSHCSCYGLEGQWYQGKDTVMLEELENRLVNGTFGEDDWSDNNFKEELCEFLGVEVKYNNDRSYY